MAAKRDIKPITHLKNHSAALVREISEEGRTVIIITHDPVALEVADRVIGLEAGHIVNATSALEAMLGSPADLDVEGDGERHISPVRATAAAAAGNVA